VATNQPVAPRPCQRCQRWPATPARLDCPAASSASWANDANTLRPRRPAGPCGQRAAGAWILAGIHPARLRRIPRRRACRSKLKPHRHRPCCCQYLGRSPSGHRTPEVDAGARRSLGRRATGQGQKVRAGPPPGPAPPGLPGCPNSGNTLLSSRRSRAWAPAGRGFRSPGYPCRARDRAPVFVRPSSREAVLPPMARRSRTQPVALAIQPAARECGETQD